MNITEEMAATDAKKLKATCMSASAGSLRLRASSSTMARRRAPQQRGGVPRQRPAGLRRKHGGDLIDAASAERFSQTGIL
eukprot:3610982-Pleurochrysis_carterae.AAC.2